MLLILVFKSLLLFYHIPQQRSCTTNRLKRQKMEEADSLAAAVLREALENDNSGRHLAAAQGYLKYFDITGEADPVLVNRANLIVKTVSDYNRQRGNISEELIAAGTKLLKPMNMDPEECAKWMFVCYGPPNGSNWGLKEANAAAHICNGESISPEQWQHHNGISCQDIYQNYASGFPFSFDIELSVNFLELSAAFDNPSKTARLLEERKSILASQENRKRNSEIRWNRSDRKVTPQEAREVMKSLRKECRRADGIKRTCHLDLDDGS